MRTLADTEVRYNPVGYHVGTVWPFDNAIIAWGMRRYGFNEEAARIATGILDAATYFQGRLPEAFAGYPRKRTKYPVQHPTACSPQAWSTGAPLMLLRTMLGLEPSGENMVINPALPEHIGHLELLDIPGRWQRSYTRDEWLDQLPTTGALTRLAPDKLAEVLDGVGAAIDATGGGFTMRYATVAVTANRRTGAGT